MHYRYKIKLLLLLLLINKFFSLVRPGRDIFAVQSNFKISILAPSRLKNEKTIIKSYSQSKAKKFFNQQKTQYSAFSNSQSDNYVPLAAISQNQKSQKMINNKVHVFEIEESDERPDSAIGDGETGHQKNIWEDIELSLYNQLFHFAIQYMKVKRTGDDSFI